jgi:hypothetical protein
MATDPFRNRLNSAIRPAANSNGKRGCGMVILISGASMMLVIPLAEALVGIPEQGKTRLLPKDRAGEMP